MKKFSSLLLVSLLIATCLLSACSSTSKEVPPDTGNTTITVEDALGRTVTFEQLPQRIVIAGRSNFMVNDAVYLFPQAAERVVALTKANQRNEFTALFEPQIEDKARLTADASADEIAALNPDVVLLKSFMADKLGRTLEELDIPVVYLGLETQAQYVDDIATLGALLGEEERAAEINAFYQQQLEKISGLVSKATEKPRVLVVRYDAQSGEVALKVPSLEWMQSWMAEFAGGELVWEEAAASGWTVVNLEQIAAWDPEVVFVISYFTDVEEAVAKIKGDPIWQTLTAVQAGKVYGFPQDYYSWDQPDTRWILGVTWLAKRVQPELCAELDIQETFYDFYRLYGLDDETIDAEVLSRLQGDIQ
ncbi:MAG: ABC transporter substrate-binding protein [Chloroflexota bacterium]|nr:ABC transporter substrate-binding protein [Chloroflexota bacterium]